MCECADSVNVLEMSGTASTMILGFSISSLLCISLSSLCAAVRVFPGPAIPTVIDNTADINSLPDNGCIRNQIQINLDQSELNAPVYNQIQICSDAFEKNRT